MNTRQTELWNNLMLLVTTHEEFFYSDQEIVGKWFRIFNYRLASYQAFMLPDALNCRGHTFEINEAGNNATPIRIASWTLPKFFNWMENPQTMDLDLSTIKEFATKMDGSFISSYTIDGELFLKSKGSLGSDQAIDSMGWMNLPENTAFHQEIIGAERLGYTVAMEWVGPNNRIVLSYLEPELRVIGIINTEDGTLLEYNDIDVYIFPEIMKRWTKLIPVKNPIDFVNQVKDLKGIEGFVCRLESGQLFKLKCEQYLALHHTKDSINSPRRLFEAVLEEATDDMRSLFYDDKMAINLIDDMEAFVDKKYNHMVDLVERYHERNKHLGRKEYAILGQEELPRMYFSLAMNKYIEREFSYKDFLKSKWKDLGLKDQVKNEEESDGTTLVVDLESIPPSMKVVD